MCGSESRDGCLDEREWTKGVHALPVELGKAGTAQQIGRLLDGARTFALAEERRGSQPAREEVDNHHPSAMTSDSGTLEQAGLLVAPVIKRQHADDEIKRIVSEGQSLDRPA